MFSRKLWAPIAPKATADIPDKPAKIVTIFRGIMKQIAKLACNLLGTNI